MNVTSRKAIVPPVQMIAVNNFPLEPGELLLSSLALTEESELYLRSLKN